MTGLISNLLKYWFLNEIINSRYFDPQEYYVWRLEPINMFLQVPRLNASNYLHSQQLSLHEIVLEDHPCRLFFDIDFKIAEEKMEETIKSIIMDLCSAITPILHHLAVNTNRPIDTKLTQMHVLISCNPSINHVPGLFEMHNIVSPQAKGGLHIIMNNLVFENIKQMGHFVEDMLPMLMHTEWYDVKIYHKNTSLRLINCPKSKENPRILRPMTRQQAENIGLLEIYHEVTNNFEPWFITPSVDQLPITYINQQQADRNPKEKRENVRIKNAECIYNYLVEQNIISACFSLKEPQGNLVHMIREIPGYCTSCERIHDNENAWFAVWANHNQFYIILGCYRSSNQVTTNVPSNMVACCEPITNEQYDWFEMDVEEILSKECNQICSNVQLSKSLEEEIQDWYRYTRHITIIDQPYFELIDVREKHNIFVIGAMGTGKTESLCSLIEQCINSVNSGSCLLGATMLNHLT